MARQSKPRGAKQPMVREAAVAYESRSMAEVFWVAFRSLPAEDQEAFLERLLNDPEFYDEIADAVMVIERENEPTRPFEEFAEELRREGRL